MERENKISPLIMTIIHAVILYLLDKIVPVILFIIPLIYAIVCLYYTSGLLKRDSGANGLEKFFAILLMIYAIVYVFSVILAVFTLLGVFAVII